MSHGPVTLAVLDDATIRSLLVWPDVIELIDVTFAADARGQATVLPVVGHSLNGGRYSLKTSHLRLGNGEEMLEVFGLKMGSYFPGNVERHLPTHSAAMLLGDPRTGQPAALLAANAITEFRTAAAGAVAARRLAREDASVVALFGTGGQARAQIEALTHVRSVREVRVWSRSRERAESFVDRLNLPGVTAKVVMDGQAACHEADLVVTVTPATRAIIEREWITPGTHVNAMGSDAPGKQELDPALVASAKVVVDRRGQSVGIGELQAPVARGLMRVEDVHAELGEVCAALRPGRENDREITVFDSTGVSFQDTALAGMALRVATARQALKSVSL
ncbi:ornithine cyclodeaminase family protein [Deinococcus yavapaiensis]|uniref:Ornithine cyclodeaminase/alanine dehydrogenase n=1 Tax=Deinococcus yavapaiensis KR-236 TaxID=694435 RepID=A0A318S0L5_9DEIO|nr:ornithine cyclodeaminase family protein [Deinococcus yavapaiensis]PYE50525.1 ornithine cyclodeaminase/alanine dehydrogenase [Deinococcus yavapaiensis KR-236]